MGIPDLEDWDKIQRRRKALKATDTKPVVYFLVVSDGMNPRYYPFFVDR